MDVNFTCRFCDGEGIVYSVTSTDNLLTRAIVEETKTTCPTCNGEKKRTAMLTLAWAWD